MKAAAEPEGGIAGRSAIRWRNERGGGIVAQPLLDLSPDHRDGVMAVGGSARIVMKHDMLREKTKAL